jgi:hypothetical protein
MWCYQETIRTNYRSCFTAHKQEHLSKRSGIYLALKENILGLAMFNKTCHEVDDPLLPFSRIEAAFL